MDVINRDSPGGGLAIIYCQDLCCEKVHPSTLTGKTFESAHWIINKDKHAVGLHLLYRPLGKPGKSLLLFIDEFTRYLDRALKNTNPIFLGDFNVHVNNPEDTDAVDFIMTTEALGLDQHVDFCTHNKGHTLDLVLSPHITKMAILKTIPGPYFSDHRAVIITVGLQKPKYVWNLITYRKIREINIMEFRTLLSTMLGNLQMEDSSLSTLVAQFDSIAETLLDIFAPKKSRLVTNRPKPIWYTKELKFIKKDLRKLEAQWQNFPTEHTWAVFKERRKSYKYQI